MSQEKTKLSRADRKQIEAAIAKAKNTDKRHKSAQDSIPFQRMFPDGICRVTDYYYSKTVQFQDINYQLNQNEDKTAIFDSWCDFLNYFDSSIHFQLSFVNLAANKDSYAQTIAIPPRADAFNQLRTEYTKMLQTQLARGNNGLVKTKFITFGVEADNLKTAKPRLERIEIDILNNFKRLGVQAEPLNGHDRLKLMHDVLHMDEQEPFRFSWDWLAPSGLSVKDFIAPSSFEFRTGSSFAVGKKYGRASFLQILAPELNDRMLADFLDMESSVIVSMHIQSVDQVKAIKTIKRKITDLDKMKIEEQKKAIRAGYDMDITVTIVHATFCTPKAGETVSGIDGASAVTNLQNVGGSTQYSGTSGTDPDVAEDATATISISWGTDGNLRIIRLCFQHSPEWFYIRFDKYAGQAEAAADRRSLVAGTYSYSGRFGIPACGNSLQKEKRT